MDKKKDNKAKQDGNPKTNPGNDALASEKKATHSYDYTQSQNIQDAQKEFENAVEKKQCVLGSERYEEPAQENLLSNNTPLNIDKSDSAYDYTRSQNIQDAQKEFEASVDKKRMGSEKKLDTLLPKDSTGTPKEDSISKSDNSSGLSGENSHSKSIQGTQTLNNTALKNPNRSEYNYVNNQNTIEAQKQYDNKVGMLSGISGSGNLSLSRDKKGGLPGDADEDVCISRINRYRGVDKKIEELPVDLSELYEQSAKGGAASSSFTKEFGASESDLNNLLNTRDIVSSRGVKFKVADTMNRTAGTVSHYLYNVSSSGTDFGQGVRQIQTMAAPVAFIVTDRMMMSAKKTLKKNLFNRLNTLSDEYRVFGKPGNYLERPELGLTTREIQALQQELIGKLKPSELTTIKKNGRGVVTYNQLNKFLKENKGKLLKSEEGAVLMLKELDRYKILDDSIRLRRHRARTGIRTRLFRYIQQDNAGQGLVFTYNLYYRGYQTLKYGLRSVRKIAQLIGLAGKLALKGAVKAAAKLATTRLGEKIRLAEIGEKAALRNKNVRNRIENEKIDLKDKFKNSRWGKMKESFMERHRKVRSFMRDPFSLKRNRAATLKRLANTKAGRAIGGFLSPFNVLKQVLARLLAGLMAAISALLSVIMVIALIFIVAVLIIIVIMSLMMAIMSMFDLSQSDEDIIKDGLVYIKELSEKQNEQLTELNNRYANVNIRYESVKDEEAYNDPENQLDRPVVETTNSAEIMSMAQVYFDFDLESAGKSKLKDYIKKLYNGSHLVEVIEHPVYTEDEDGNQVLAYTNADVNYVTYYFNALFECELVASGGVGVVAGNDITEQVWNYLRTAGVGPAQAAGVMGNMYCESGFDPTIVEYGNGIGFGLCQWSYERRENLENFAANQGKSPGDLKVQLDFFMTEYNRESFIGHYDEFMAASTPEEAAEHFLWGWERPLHSAGVSTLPTRQSAARTYYDTYVDKELVTEEAKE